MSGPSYKALEDLRALLPERNDTREVDGEPWVLMSPELMLQLVRDKELADAELAKCKWMLDEALLDDHYSDRDDLERRWAERRTT